MYLLLKDERVVVHYTTTKKVTFTLPVCYLHYVILLHQNMSLLTVHLKLFKLTLYSEYMHLKHIHVHVCISILDASTPSGYVHQAVTMPTFVLYGVHLVYAWRTTNLKSVLSTVIDLHVMQCLKRLEMIYKALYKSNIYILFLFNPKRQRMEIGTTVKHNIHREYKNHDNNQINYKLMLEIQYI